MKITILIENSKPEGSTLTAEHGLSFFVETARQKFIFDCGQSGAAFDNAKILGVDLSGVKFAVLSHNHYDHAGGFGRFMDFAPVEKIFTGENFWDEKFSRDEFGNCKYRGGLRKNFITERGIEQVICRDVIALDEDCWLVGNFKRRYDFEKIPKRFLRGDKKIPDDFRDEIILVLRGGDGLTVVTACAHVGVLNIVADVRERLGAVSRVIGGLHLVNATSERIDRTLAELEILGAKKILPCHCSGEEFVSKCRDRLFSGSVIEIY